jgi:hypothetical protein
MVKIGRLPIQLSLGARYWAESIENGPEGWGGRMQTTFISPRQRYLKKKAALQKRK